MPRGVSNENSGVLFYYVTSEMAVRGCFRRTTYLIKCGMLRQVEFDTQGVGGTTFHG